VRADDWLRAVQDADVKEAGAVVGHGENGALGSAYRLMVRSIQSPSEGLKSTNFCEVAVFRNTIISRGLIGMPGPGSW
jgi:hypothetical protein